MQNFIITNLPQAWKLRQFGKCCKKISDNYKPVENGNTPYIGLEHIASGFPKLVDIGIESEVKSSKTKFCVNDILFGKLRPYLRKAILAKFNGICSTDILVFRVNDELSPEFLIYLVHSDPFIKYAISTTTGVNHPRTSWNAIKNLEIPLPPIKEQKIIAGVLSLVQNAIRQQEKAIALTTELKKALMQKLFTEGLRGEAQKQTEIGLIPESWNLIKCSQLCKEITVGVVVKPASYYVNFGIPAFRSLNIQEDRLVIDKLVYFSSEDNDGKLAKSKVYAGDVLIIRTGYPGTSCVVSKQYDGVNCIDLVIARPKNTMSSHFLSRFFNSSGGKLQALSAKHGLAQQHLNVGAVKNVLVPVPSTLEEQNEIIKYLEYIDRKIRIYENKSDLLKEFFQTLLHQLMTAKIRVSELNLDSLNLDLEDKD